MFESRIADPRSSHASRAAQTSSVTAARLRGSRQHARDTARGSTPEAGRARSVDLTAVPVGPLQGGSLVDSEVAAVVRGPVATAGGGSASSGLAGGAATSISTTNLDGPTWGNYGEFKWWISWVTDGTSGWVVQKVENAYSGSYADSSAITNATVGAEPSYYEAWEVAANGTITGSPTVPVNRDQFERPALSTGSHGSWGMTGTVYWTSTDPAGSGFSHGAIGNAGVLLSARNAPAGIGSALHSRSAHGMWDATGAQMLPGCFVT
jgi:hypothetical protein